MSFSKYITVLSHKFYGAEVGLGIADIVSGISRPIHIGIVWIQPLSGRLQGKPVQIIVGVTRLSINALHHLEDTAWEDRSFVQAANTVNGDLQEGLGHHTPLRSGTGSVVNGSKRQLVTASTLQCIPCLFNEVRYTSSGTNPAACRHAEQTISSPSEEGPIISNRLALLPYGIVVRHLSCCYDMINGIHRLILIYPYSSGIHWSLVGQAVSHTPVLMDIPYLSLRNILELSYGS